MSTSSNLYQAFFNTASDAIFASSLATGTIVEANARYSATLKARSPAPFATVVEHAVLVENSPVISPASLPMNLTAKESPEASTELGLRDMLNLLERQIILDTLVRANWIKKRAAEMLRIDARNLPYLLRKHNLSESYGPC